MKDPKGSTFKHIHTYSTLGLRTTVATSRTMYCIVKPLDSMPPVAIEVTKEPSQHGLPKINDTPCHNKHVTHL